MACCTDLGILDPCEPINTNINATQDGVYKYTLTMPLGRFKGTLDVLIGDPLIIDCYLNENSFYKLDIVAPDGTKLDCIEFKTRYILNCQTQST